MSIREGMVWPPRDLAEVLHTTCESKVWWKGGVEGLNEYYLHENAAKRIGGTMARIRNAYDAFWGRTNTNPAQPIKKIHVPIAAGIVDLSARSLFAKRVLFVDPTGDKGVQKRTDDIFNTDMFHSALYTSGASCSALGGNYQRVVWDPEVADHCWIDFVDANRAIPVFRWGRLVEVTFWSELESDDDRVVWRHLERRVKGRIEHQLYRGTPSDLGALRPLQDHPSTEPFATLVDDGFGILTGVDELSAAYVPNKLPNPDWVDDPRLKDLGRSDINADTIPLLHGIDKIESSEIRDFDIGAARMFASDDLLTNMGAGKGAVLPEDQAIFTRVGTGTKGDELTSMFQFHQPEIRVETHQLGKEGLVRELLKATGYSPMSFGFSDEVAMTATEASGKKEATVETTEGKARYYTAALSPLVTTCLRIDAAMFPGKGKAPVERMELEWPKFAEESDLSKSQTVMNWQTAGAASTRTKVAYIHDDWDDEAIKAEAALIDKANELTAPDFGGGFGGDQPPLPTDQPPADDARPAQDAAVTK